MILSKLKERPKRLRFTPVYPEPTPEQIKLFYILNTIDLALTIHGLKSYPEIQEGNPFLGKNPSVKKMLLHKAILAPLIEQNFNEYQMTFVNTALGVAVVNNAAVLTRYGAW